MNPDVTQTSPDPEANPRRGQRVLRGVLYALTGLFVLAIAVVFWPRALGGRVQLISVSGTSMLPTYKSGDLIVAVRDKAVETGEIAIYSVPSPHCAAGKLVIHRLVDSTDKGLLFKGDNRPSRDPFYVPAGNVQSRPWLHIGGLGRVVSLFLKPWVLMLVVGLLVTWVLWPDDDDDDDDAPAGFGTLRVSTEQGDFVLPNSVPLLRVVDTESFDGSEAQDADLAFMLVAVYRKGGSAGFLECVNSGQERLDSALIDKAIRLP